MKNMKAVICTKYGPPEVLEIRDVPKPIPKDDEILVKIHATSVTSGDARMRRYDVPLLFWLPFRLFLGVFKPKNPIPGIELSGEIEQIGKDVTKFQVGDQVFTYPNSGTCAQYISLPEKTILTKRSDKITHEQAATLFFGAHTAWHFLKMANIQPGQKVLIHGATGALGTYAVQLAKMLGAEVTAVCSTENFDLVRSLGADKLIDYKKEDFTKNGETYDVIFCTVGKSPFTDSVNSLSENGFYLRAVHLSIPTILQGMWISSTTNKKIIGGIATEHQEDLEYLKTLAEEGKIKPVISKTYSLDQIVEANRYVDTGHKIGNVAIIVSHES